MTGGAGTLLEVMQKGSASEQSNESGEVGTDGFCPEGVVCQVGEEAIPGASLGGTALTGSRIMTKTILSFRQVEFNGPRGQSS